METRTGRTTRRGRSARGVEFNRGLLGKRERKEERGRRLYAIYCVFSTRVSTGRARTSVSTSR